MTTLPRPLIALGSAALLLFATGCGDAADKVAEQAVERAIESETGGDVDIDTDGDGSVSFETDEGSFSSDGEGNLEIESADGSTSISSDGEIPEGWPEEVPLPADLEVTLGSSMDAADGRLLSVMGTTSESATDLLDEMKAALADWTISGEVVSTTDGSTTTSAQFELDGRRVNFLASETPDGTTFQAGHTTLS
jgi:flagellar basal body rod protein FlgF